MNSQMFDNVMYETTAAKIVKCMWRTTLLVKSSLNVFASVGIVVLKSIKPLNYRDWT